MADTNEELREVRNFQNGQIEVIFRKATPIDPRYPGFNPGVQVEDGILIEQDVAVPMRDGTIIYTDIYRPEGATNLPAIVAWSPYGKRVRQEMTGSMVPEGTNSPMAKAEGPDPAYWCHYGYAVINPDARGSWKSEGNLFVHGVAEAQDCSDLIEWVATRDWSNGKVGMSGNSWLAAIQWWTGSVRPPHLAAIAPWEGLSDCYRDYMIPGGIPEPGFMSLILGMTILGERLIEDIPAMIHKYPLMNAYWEDKVAPVENIEIPAYVVASWTNFLHTHGTIDAYRRLSSPNKWLRVHNTMEWPDFYTPENLEDLRRFFDRYLKGIRNGWELTPRVRLSILDPGGIDQVNRPEKEFPLARTQYQKLFLDAATGTLSPDAVKKESETRYKADDGKGQATFTIKFSEDTELTGYMKLRLWVEADGADDMDLFVSVGKLDAQGNLIPIHVVDMIIPPVAQGILRVSHRELDEARSTPSEPYHPHRREQLLKPKEIVPVEVGLWPTGVLWHAGQQLCVFVKGYGSSWMMDGLARGAKVIHHEVRNRGDHIIHTGGKYDSHLLVPMIPR
jgi:predicted acyl esterase